MKYTPIEFYEELAQLTIFRGLKDQPIIKSFQNMLGAICENEKRIDVLSACCQFASDLYSESSYDTDTVHPKTELTANWTDVILRLLVNDENFYMKAYAFKRPVSTEITAQLNKELLFLEAMSRIDSKRIEKWLHTSGYTEHLPVWTASEHDFIAEYEDFLNNIQNKGFGMFADYGYFMFTDNALIPVKHPDMQDISKLTGYERERNQVIKNTEIFLDGGTASNVLLYGDAGTGKSSTVKAVSAHFKDRGLRLVEVRTNQLFQIPHLLDMLSSIPLKFILFIDDLSFTSNDDNFSVLKSILEGGISSCGENVRIYATSNRRHLVKETMSERSGDELYLNDTLQETMSLSARFGLAITFQRPGKDDYLSIVKDLAAQYGIDIPEEELFIKAEAYAIRSNGRSPRTAKHFIELQKAGI